MLVTPDLSTGVLGASNKQSNMKHCFGSLVGAHWLWTRACLFTMVLDVVQGLRGFKYTSGWMILENIYGGSSWLVC